MLAVPGVTGAEALQFSLTADGTVADILHASDRQFLTLVPADLDIRMVEPGLLTQDTGGAS